MLNNVFNETFAKLRHINHRCLHYIHECYNSNSRVNLRHLFLWEKHFYKWFNWHSNNVVPTQFEKTNVNDTRLETQIYSVHFVFHQNTFDVV